MKIDGHPVKVGDLLAHKDLMIRVMEIPETGSVFVACVVKSSYGNVGYISDDFNKQGWTTRGVMIMLESKFRKGEIVRGVYMDILVTGEGVGVGQFSGTIIRVNDNYDGSSVVGDARTTFNTTSFTRNPNGIFINQLPAYSFGVGDLVMCSGTDSYEYVIRVLKMDSQLSNPGVYFSGMIIDGNQDADDCWGDVRDFFRISQFYKVTASYTRGE